MSLRANYFKRVFQFNFKARTSRGLMKDKTSWFVKIYDEQSPEVFGLGEIGPLPGLSPDAKPDLEQTIHDVIDTFNRSDFSSAELIQLEKLVPHGYPSLTFGFETALMDFSHGGKRILFHNSFVDGTGIDINGLIWMGDMDFMMSQIHEKITKGFRCIKLKVGGLDFDRECDILRYIRNKYFREDITIRLDANGAFKLDDVLYKLEQLSKYNIHSIEQPIKPGLEVMEELCRKSPIPVAFDEELIGVETAGNKAELLQRLKPHFIVLKPTLHGGLKGSREWIEVAERMNIGWWITSALESSVGLNAISQFAADFKTDLPQGLGTGMIYENNFNSPLVVDRGKIFYNSSLAWENNFD